MIQHTVSNNVLSSFNPILSLKPNIKDIVNQNFFVPILNAYFGDKIALYEALNINKLKTDIDFNKAHNFVNGYIYPEIINLISKDNKGKVNFKPKYVFTFDKDLTPNKRETLLYPYQDIFKGSNDYKNHNNFIYDGKMKLGEEPILYYIWIDFQVLMKFIKTIKLY